MPSQSLDGEVVGGAGLTRPPATVRLPSWDDVKLTLEVRETTVRPGGDVKPTWRPYEQPLGDRSRDPIPPGAVLFRLHISME